MNTTYFLNCTAGNIFKTQTTPALPTKYYIGVSSSAPTISGTNVTEPEAAAAYKRIELTSLGTPTDGVVSNTKVIDFDESTDAWGLMTYFVIYDSLTNGNLLMYGQLTTARTVEAATILSIKIGDLKLSTQNPS